MHEIYVDHSNSHHESDSNSYQSKIFGRKFNNEPLHKKEVTSFKTPRGGFTITVGHFDESSRKTGSHLNVNGIPAKSTFAKPSTRLIPQGSVSFSYSNPERSKGDLNKFESKLALSSSSSSISSDSCSSGSWDGHIMNDQLISKPGDVRLRRKSKSFIFDFMTEKANSVLPPETNNLKDNRSQRNFLHSNTLGNEPRTAGNRRPTSVKYNQNDPEIYKSYVQQMKSFLQNVSFHINC